MRISIGFGFVAACFLVFAPVGVYSDLAVFPVVGEYDGADGNSVDKNADFYPGNSSGDGDDESLVLKIDEFRKTIKEAFEGGRGGVVGFDDVVVAGGSKTDAFGASFGEGKTLVVKSVDHLRTDSIAANVITPISGPKADLSGGFLSKSNVDGDTIKIKSSFDFTLTEEGFGKNEHVQAVGATILGRNGAVEASKWLMKVQLDNGDIIAQMADVNFKSGNSKGDTFFGATAPEGRYITAVSWISMDGNHSGLDGFAFFTNGAEKEPPPPEVVEVVTPKVDEFGLPIPTYGSGGGSDDDVESFSPLFGSDTRH